MNVFKWMFSWHVAGESLHWDSFEQFCVWQLISAESPDCQLVIPALANLNPEGTCSSGRRAANPQLAMIPCASKHYYCICAITHPLISYAPLFWVLNFVFELAASDYFPKPQLIMIQTCTYFQTLVRIILMKVQNYIHSMDNNLCSSLLIIFCAYQNIQRPSQVHCCSWKLKCM